ncbi:hypothetical protein BC831DRAFT_434504 [Entophlyctis helioformis]|nr:hypothetical protein BC831DRAFT_434504 [Entophlyctis helioformis]
MSTETAQAAQAAQAAEAAAVQQASAAILATPRARPSHPSKDIMPGFEEKIQRTTTQLALGPGSFVLQDGLAFMAYGAQAIAQDEFSKCFTPKPRNTFMSLFAKGPIYTLDWAVRYFLLFPFRVLIMLVASLFFFSALPVVLYLKDEMWQRWLFKFYCRAFVASWGGYVKYHGTKPRLDTPTFLLPTTPRAHSFPHATVAQKHGGLIGYFEESVLTLNGSLMFNRSEKNDRAVLARKMREHVANPSKVPLLIFPEVTRAWPACTVALCPVDYTAALTMTRTGHCVNNEHTVLFHKGAFDLDAMIAPVAIKYNKQWADAYWHSKTQSFTYHLLYLMTRWALVADVTYLEPRARREGQSAEDFANEVKAEISSVARLKNLSWDGYFKNFAPPVEKRNKLKQNTQTRYGAVLRSRQKNGNGHVRRSSFSAPERKSSLSESSAEHHLFFADEMPAPTDRTQGSTSSKNMVLVALNDSERRQDMIEAIANRRNNVVDTWKRYTKMRSGDDELRRLENSSWRLWHKQRIEQQRRREEEEMLSLLNQSPAASFTGDLEDETYYPFDHPLMLRKRRPSLDAGSMLSLVSLYFPTFGRSRANSQTHLFPPSGDVPDGPPGEIRRARSFGSAMAALGMTSLNTSRSEDKTGQPGMQPPSPTQRAQSALGGLLSPFPRQRRPKFDLDGGDDD